MTREIIELILKYQVPGDLLSFDGRFIKCFSFVFKSQTNHNQNTQIKFECCKEIASGSRTHEENEQNNRCSNLIYIFSFFSFFNFFSSSLIR